MTRVTDLSAHNTVVRYMLQTQQRLHEANEQVASGKISGRYSGISEAQRLVNLENEASESERYIQNNTIADVRMQISFDAVEAMRTTIKNFESQLIDFKASDTTDVNNVKQIQEFAMQAMKEMETYLNTKADGQYIFSGSAVHTEPVALNLTSLSAFQSTYDGELVTYPTTRDAHLANQSYSSDENNVNSTLIDNANWLRFTQDDDGDLTNRAVGSIEAPTDVFKDMKAGMTITLTDAGPNNGTYTISSVSDDGTKIFVDTEAFTDEGVVSEIPEQASSYSADITINGETTLSNTTTGGFDFDPSNNTLTARNNGSLTSVSAGDTIEITDAGENNGFYQVASVNGDEITIATNQNAKITTYDDEELTADDFTNLSFDRDNNTITASTADAFANMAVGEVFEVSGTGRNDGTYTIASNDGTTITIEENKLTDSGLTAQNAISRFSDEAIVDSLNDETTATAIVTLPNGSTLGAAAGDFTNLTFENDNETITATGGTPFAGLSAGDTITISGGTANDGTYTIGTVSGNGTTLNIKTSTENLNTVANEAGINITLADGTVLNNANTGNISFNAAGTLQLDNASNWESLGLSEGDTFTITGSTGGVNDGTYTVSGLSNAGGTNDVLSIQQTPDETITLADGSTLDYTNYGNLVFDRSANSVTAENAGSLAGLNVGDTFTIAGTSGNDGTYTVASNDGTTLTINAVDYQDAGDIYFQLPVATEATFTTTEGASTLKITNPDGSALGAFSGLSVGDTITLDGATQTSDVKDDTLIDSLTDGGPFTAATITTSNGRTFSSVDFTSLTFEADDSTITAASGIPFATMQPGETITISGTGTHDGIYTIGTKTNNVLNIKVQTESLANEAGAAGATVLLPNGNQLTNAETGNISFSAGAGTITSDTAQSWIDNGVSVGDVITIDGTGSNDGTFIVSAIGGGSNETITIQQTRQDQITLPNQSTLNSASYGNLSFDQDNNTITASNAGSLAGLNEGDIFTISGAGENSGTYQVSSNDGTTLSVNPYDNNGTFTIASISEDGSTVTFEEDLNVAGVDTDGLNITGPGDFKYSSGTQMVFDATNDYIEIQTSGNGAAVPGAFSDLRPGMTIDANFTENNNGTYTISSISADGSRIYVNEDITRNETEANDAVLTSYGTTGTITAQGSYYQGDENSNTHRLNENRSFEMDINAIDPGFEKAIRAMGLVAQGEFGTAGGLDQEENQHRVDDAIYLLRDALGAPAEGEPPYGEEITTSSITQMELDIGYRQSLLKQSDAEHKSYVAFLESNIARLENADPLEAITTLLDESRTLEASYQALSKVRSLSLHNFL